MLTKKLTYGEALRLEVDRSGHDFTDIATACSYYEEGARSTYAALLDMRDLPSAATGPGRKARRRLYLLCLTIGIDLGDYELTDDDRSLIWKRTDDQMRKHLSHLLISVSRWTTTTTQEQLKFWPRSADAPAAGGSIQLPGGADSEHWARSA